METRISIANKNEVLLSNVFNQLENKVFASYPQVSLVACIQKENNCVGFLIKIPTCLLEINEDSSHLGKILDESFIGREYSTLVLSFKKAKNI